MMEMVVKRKTKKKKKVGEGLPNRIKNGEQRGTHCQRAKQRYVKGEGRDFGEFCCDDTLAFFKDKTLN